MPKMKPLVFPAPVPSSAPAAKADGPKPLPFAPAVQKPKALPTTAQENAFDAEVNVVSARERVPLAFPPSAPRAAPPLPICQACPGINHSGCCKQPPKTIAFPPSAPRPAPAPTQQTPSSAFRSELSPIALAAIEEIKKVDPATYAKYGARLEKQISNLVPLNVTRIMSWATKPLTALTQISSDCATIVRDFSTGRGAELIDETLKTLTSKPSMLDRMMARGNQVSTKPQLMVLRAQLTAWMPKADQLIKDAADIHEQLSHKMTTLRVVTDVCGKCPDITLEEAIDDRQKLLLQATMQAQIVMQQLNDIRRQIVDQLSRVEQMVNVTIPAYETAKAHR